MAETVEISQDVARKLIESCREHGNPLSKGLRPANKAGVELTIPVGARWGSWKVLPIGRGQWGRTA